MPDDAHPLYLVASPSPGLLKAVECGLAGSEARVRAVSCVEATLDAITGPLVPCLLLLDPELPGMPLEQFLAALSAGGNDRRFPVVLVCDDVRPGWKDRLHEGVIDDILPREMPHHHWRLRFDMALRMFRHSSELEHLRETACRDTDPLTGLSNRGALLSMLFRETDRVQRMNTPLSVMLFEVDDLSHWRRRLGATACDDLLVQVVGRVRRLLRSYDLFGRMGPAGFALALPGCTPVNAVLLAERIRAEVFCIPFQAGPTAIRLTASFGIAPSHGRSPLVVLRDAEQALEAARAAGPEAIRASRNRTKAAPSPAEFLSAVPASGL